MLTSGYRFDVKAAQLVAMHVSDWGFNAPWALLPPQSPTLATYRWHLESEAREHAMHVVLRDRDAQVKLLAVDAVESSTFHATIRFRFVNTALENVTKEVWFLSNKLLTNREGVTSAGQRMARRQPGVRSQRVQILLPLNILTST